ncbi:MAG: hypothetical protein QXZ60_01590 [Sulfolobales archaeon]
MLEDRTVEIEYWWIVMRKNPAKKVLRYRNCDIERIVAIIPRGHRHMRMIIELPDQILVFSEATTAAIARAYISVVTHPQRRSIELIMRKFKPEEIKPAYSECQLIESSATDEELQQEWGDFIDK